MRISDWSSDVCSSDLIVGLPEEERLDHVPRFGALDEMREDRHFAADRTIEALRETELDTVEDRDRRRIIALGLCHYTGAHRIDLRRHRGRPQIEPVILAQMG